MGHLIFYPVLTWFITISYVFIVWYSYAQGQEWRMLLTQRKQRGISIPEEASSPLSLASCRLPPPVSNVMFTAMLQRYPQAHHFPALALAHCPCRPSMVESLWMERGEGLGIRVYGVPHDSRWLSSLLLALHPTSLSHKGCRLSSE
jgi:hypothetical protein